MDIIYQTQQCTYRRELIKLYIAQGIILYTIYQQAHLECNVEEIFFYIILRKVQEFWNQKFPELKKMLFLKGSTDHSFFFFERTTLHGTLQNQTAYMYFCNWLQPILKNYYIMAKFTYRVPLIVSKVVDATSYNALIRVQRKSVLRLAIWASCCLYVLAQESFK